MTTRPVLPPHEDTLDVALAHFNSQFRKRYRLPSVTAARLRRDVIDIDERLGDLALVRQNGVRDASCALIANIVLTIVPRYAIGLLDEFGRVSVLAPEEGDERSYRSHHVLLVNPLGGSDNWAGISRWVRGVGGDRARRTELAGLASEERPDANVINALLWQASTTHDRAVAYPPDEAFSAERAAEVNYIYGVSPETLRTWKRRYRGPLAARKPGAPRKNR